MRRGGVGRSPCALGRMSSGCSFHRQGHGSVAEHHRHSDASSTGVKIKTAPIILKQENRNVRLKTRETTAAHRMRGTTCRMTWIFFLGDGRPLFCFLFHISNPSPRTSSVILSLQGLWELLTNYAKRNHLQLKAAESCSCLRPVDFLQCWRG